MKLKLFYLSTLLICLSCSEKSDDFTSTASPVWLEMKTFVESNEWHPKMKEGNALFLASIKEEEKEGGLGDFDIEDMKRQFLENNKNHYSFDEFKRQLNMATSDEEIERIYAENPQHGHISKDPNRMTTEDMIRVLASDPERWKVQRENKGTLKFSQKVIDSVDNRIERNLAAGL